VVGLEFQRRLGTDHRNEQRVSRVACQTSDAASTYTRMKGVQRSTEALMPATGLRIINALDGGHHCPQSNPCFHLRRHLFQFRLTRAVVG
jgi:hypothetical protein